MYALHLQSTPERRVVETGRVCLCNYGKFCGKLVVIVNVIDGRRVLVDGPSEGSSIKRQVRTVPLTSKNDKQSHFEYLCRKEGVMQQTKHRSQEEKVFTHEETPQSWVE